MTVTVTIKLRNGSEATISGKQFTVPGLEDVPFIVHRPIGSDKGWMVTEPVTGYRILSYSLPIRKDAIEEATRRCVGICASAYVRATVEAARKAVA